VIPVPPPPSRPGSKTPLWPVALGGVALLGVAGVLAVRGPSKRVTVNVDENVSVQSASASSSAPPVAPSASAATEEADAAAETDVDAAVPSLAEIAGDGGPRAPGDEMLGNYGCTINKTIDMVFMCVIKRDKSGALILHKTSGSQQYYGKLTPNADGFDFAGNAYCPDGDCTEPMAGAIKKIGPNTWGGEMSNGDYVGFTGPTK
jgi:hypothetical protein